LLLESTGVAESTLSSLETVYPPDKIFGKGEMWTTQVNIDGAALGDLVTVTSTTNADMAEIQLTGYVSRGNTVVIAANNITDGEISLPTLYLAVVLDKAPKANKPVIFSSSDAIGITATTDTVDVDIDSGNITVYALIYQP